MSAGTAAPVVVRDGRAYAAATVTRDQARRHDSPQDRRERWT